jgi:hypothetical protein
LSAYRLTSILSCSRTYILSPAKDLSHIFLEIVAPHRRFRLSSEHLRTNPFQIKQDNLRPTHSGESELVSYPEHSSLCLTFRQAAPLSNAFFRAIFPVTSAMDGLIAAGLAGNIFQFIQFSLDLFSRGRRIYQSSQGALPENIEAGVIVNDLLKRVNDIKIWAALAGDNADKQLMCLSETCITVAGELVSVLERVRLKGTSKKWSTVKAALLSVWTRPQIEALQKRLDMIRQELQLYMTLDQKYYSLNFLSILAANTSSAYN